MRLLFCILIFGFHFEVYADMNQDLIRLESCYNDADQLNKNSHGTNNVGPYFKFHQKMRECVHRDKEFSKKYKRAPKCKRGSYGSYECS